MKKKAYMYYAEGGPSDSNTITIKASGIIEYEGSAVKAYKWLADNLSNDCSGLSIHIINFNRI